MRNKFPDILILKTATLAAVILWGYSLAANPGDPLKLVREKDAELQKLLRLKDPIGTEHKRKQISGLINGIFDFRELGRKALGKGIYDSLPPQKQEQFVTAFQEMLENSSLKKLEVYRSDSTRYEKPKINSDKASVVAHTFYSGQHSILEYKLYLRDGSWKAWDLVIDDLSTYVNYKNLFRKMLKTKSIDELIGILEKKAADEKAKLATAAPAAENSGGITSKDRSPSSKSGESN